MYKRQEYDHVSFYQEPDNGMSDAINKGFSRAKGKWVMWLNTDDRLKPGALKAFLDFAEGKDDADVIYGGWDFIDKEGEFSRKMTIFPFQKSMLSNYGCYIGSTSAFYRNSTVISEGHHLNEDFKYVMDGEYYNRLAALGKKFIYFHARLADFRLHGENLSFRHLSSENASGRLVLEKQYAESTTIRRVYGRQSFTKPPWMWFVDGFSYGYYGLKKFVLKRFYKVFVSEVELPD